ncbi:MAG TPA: hypothetical protein PK479_06200, partial [Novosphingobium sp.]|nr:hypothetical protein [Novosphingobium sp.]
MTLLARGNPGFPRARDVESFIDDGLAIDPRTAAGNQPFGFAPAGGKADANQRVDDPDTVRRERKYRQVRADTAARA